MKVLDESKSVLYLTLVCLTLRVSYLFLFLFFLSIGFNEITFKGYLTMIFFIASTVLGEIIQ